MVEGYFIGKWAREVGRPPADHHRPGLLHYRYGASGHDAQGAAAVLLSSQDAGRVKRAAYTARRDAAYGTHCCHAARATPTPAGWQFAWLLVAMVPAAIGGGILQPSINSLITKRIDPDERGEASWALAQRF